eukprot:1019338-Alexandrium_andersonii.AAC.1
MPCCFVSFSAADHGTPADGFGRPEPRRSGSGGSRARGQGEQTTRARLPQRSGTQAAGAAAGRSAPSPTMGASARAWATSAS